MSTRAESVRSRDREWWLRSLLVFSHPRAVFAALRDESADDLAARAEPITAIVFLAGIAAALGTSAAGNLLDDPARDGLIVAVWAVFAGGISGVFAYFFAGYALYRAARWLGGQGSYRRARHVIAFAAAPLALSLVVWPVRLAVYGSDVFRSGGRDHGAGGTVFVVLELVFLAWAAALLLIGTRAVHGWSWARALATVGLAAVVFVGVGYVLNLVLGFG
jgi:hypothetical protein